MFLDIIYEQYKEIKAHLCDKESERLFEIRVEYAITHDLDKLENELFDENKVYVCEELNEFQKKFDSVRDIVIFGAGKYGFKTQEYLRHCAEQYNVVAYCDNNDKLIGKEINGLPVISVKELIKVYSDCIVIICSHAHSKDIYKQLTGEDKECLMAPTLGYPEVHCGWQYFDLFKPEEEEIFIDAGTYDGSTIEDFNKWMASDKKGFCYGLEPVKEMYEKAIARCKKKGINNAYIYNAAAWSQNVSDLHLLVDEKADGSIWGGSAINEKGSISVEAKSIDAISEENGKITFVKMDVEGSELKALEGAKNTIKEYAPRLAISIYHKPLDVLEIPSYILGIRKDYKFYIRHYGGNQNETVLYAERQ